MIELIIVPDMDGYFQGRQPKSLTTVQTPIVVGGLEGGMTSGQPSVALLIETEPGVVIMAETSLKLFLAAADLLRAKYGDPRVDPTGPAA